MDHESAESTAAQIAAKERLSALADGELDSTEMVRVCAAWREESQSRATWHAYQLIGDVLRSDDLASDVKRDAAFLSALRERLASEPIVFAPQAASEIAAEPVAQPLVAQAAYAGRSRRRAWMGASAVAAGFVAVAGVLVLTRAPGVAPGVQPADRLALSSSAAVGAQPVTVAQQTPVLATEPPALVANGKLIRDARLDRYLAAHKQFAGTSALGVPSGFLRAATTTEPDR